ncbi:MAG: helix-turn-helix transcriptional regulator [Pseudolabrys sp.]
MHIVQQASRDLVELVRLERRAFAAKLRMARAVLGWSQSELGSRVGLTQRSVHKIEQGETEPRRTTVRAIEQVWAGEGLVFEDLADGGFRVDVRSDLLDRPVGVKARRNAPLQRGAVAARIGRA